MSVAPRRRATIPRLVGNVGIYLALLAMFVTLKSRSPLALVGIVAASLALAIYAGLLIIRLTESRR